MKKKYIVDKEYYEYVNKFKQLYPNLKHIDCNNQDEYLK